MAGWSEKRPRSKRSILGMSFLMVSLGGLPMSSLSFLSHSLALVFLYREMFFSVAERNRS